MTDPGVLSITVVGAVSGLVTVVVTWLMRRSDRKAEWDRQDALATRVEAMAEAAKKMDGKLDGIHTLVNAEKTASIAREIGAAERELAMMHEVIALNQQKGRRPTKASLDAIKATETTLKELKANLEERIKQTEVANKQMGE